MLKTKINLYPWQKNALRVLSKKDKTLLGLEPGSGKTWISLFWLQEKAFKNCFIVCKNNKVNDWYNASLEFYDQSEITIFNDTTLNNKLVKLNKINIIGYTAFTLMQPKNFDCLLLDESQVINNRNTKLHKLIYKLKLPFILLITGSFHSTGYQDLFGALHILENENYAEFENRYLILKIIPIQTSYYPIKKIIGYRNVNELINRFTNLGYISKRLIEEPNINHHKISIQNYSEYKEMEKNMVLNDEAAFNRGVLFQYLRMLSSGFLKDQWYDKNKVNELNLFLNESVTIFYNWNMELESIKEFAKNNDIVTYEINGFNFQLDEFLNEKRISWMLINYKSGAEAIDGLQFKTNKSIFYSLPLSGSLLEQAHKRVNRIGQESKNIDYYYLIRENSLEEDILKNLSKYRNYTEKIFSNYLKKML